MHIAVYAHFPFNILSSRILNKGSNGDQGDSELLLTFNLIHH